MEETIGTLENLFYEKILLYRDLVTCLERERDALVRVDMEALWDLADEKQQIASKIETVRNSMVSALAEEGGLPDRFRKSHLSLLNLKSEVRRRTEENRLFVEECLGFLDELIGILTDTGKTSGAYGNMGRLPRTPGSGNLLLHKEV